MCQKSRILDSQRRRTGGVYTSPGRLAVCYRVCDEMSTRESSCWTARSQPIWRREIQVDIGLLQEMMKDAVDRDTKWATIIPIAAGKTRGSEV